MSKCIALIGVPRSQLKGSERTENSLNATLSAIHYACNLIHHLSFRGSLTFELHFPFALPRLTTIVLRVLSNMSGEAAVEERRWESSGENVVQSSHTTIRNEFVFVIPGQVSARSLFILSFLEHREWKTHHVLR